MTVADDQTMAAPDDTCDAQTMAAPDESATGIVADDTMAPATAAVPDMYRTQEGPELAWSTEEPETDDIPADPGRSWRQPLGIGAGTADRSGRIQPGIAQAPPGEVMPANPLSAGREVCQRMSSGQARIDIEELEIVYENEKHDV